MGRLAWIGMVACVVCGAWAGTAAATGNSVTVWTRAAGDHATSKPARQGAHGRALADLKVEERSLVDLQYGGEARTYRGVDLATLAGKPAAGVDTALLHFANGMVVPIPMAGPDAGRLKVFVAREWKGPEGWTSAFPKVAKKGAEARDRRPITFGANKVVVESPAHPLLTKSVADAGFSPWTHVDTLVGVEWVDATAYWAQFDVGGSPKAAGGAHRYATACAFCHGVRKVGASLGWDFVEPLPAAEHRRRPGSLAFHVRYRNANAPEMGMMMPAIKGITDDDAEQLHAWLKQVAKQPIRPYKPAK